MAGSRVVIEIYLGVERDHIAATSDDQRIDLTHTAVFFFEKQGELLQDLRELLDRLLAVGTARSQVERIGQFSRLVRAQTGHRIHVFGQYLFWGLGRDLL